ncbi:MAG: endonuclease V [Candidatus Odinarchaeia archaeon]
MDLEEISEKYGIPVKVLDKLRVVQTKLSRKIRLEKVDLSKIKTASGFDLAFPSLNQAVVAGVTLDEKFRIVEKKTLKVKITFPYIPTFLAFREGPPIIKLIKKMKPADIIFIDGHGLAHPFLLGLASYVGVIINRPVIGVAKNILIGEYEKPQAAGESTPLKYNNMTVGFALKTGEKYRPIFVSPGNLVSLEDTLKLTLKWTMKNCKLPEPIRAAHIAANSIA